jgi:uncharacterized protein (UPF0335 family)
MTTDLNVTTTVSHIGAPPPAGHNTPSGAPSVPKEASTFSKDQLKSVVARIEALEEEKKALSKDTRDVYTEAKGNGFDVKAIRTIVRLRKMKEGDRSEQEAILDTYKHALGMLV